MIDFVQVGKKIISLRKQKKMSQEVLADKLYITRQCLSKWELGISIPSVDVLLSLCQIFSVSIDEILCLDQEITIDNENIFQGHERLFIVNKLINNELNVNIDEVFYQLSPSERMLVLKNVKEDITKVDKEALMLRLTPSEQRYLGGKNYEIKKSNY